MNFKVPSKICLSLKEIDFANLEVYRKISNLLEIRLDYISLNTNNLSKLCDLFDYIILKSNNIIDYQFDSYYNLMIKYSNIFLDIDYSFIINNDNNEDLMKLLSTNPVISLHNMNLIEFEKMFQQIISNSIMFKPSMYKFVIKEDNIVVNFEKLSSLYNTVKNYLKDPNIDVIIFMEGEKNINTRYFSIKCGAPYIYCSYDESTKTGIGQPTFAEARVFFDSVSTSGF